MISRPVHVIIADDHPIVRDGLMATLASTPYLRVVAAAANFQELTTALPTVQADILILDLGGMGSSPLTVIERLTREHPHLAIIVFSSSVDLVPETLRAGAKGYVVKEELSDQLLTAIYAVRAGQTFLSPLAQEYLLRCSVQSSQHRLTPQELSVLKLLAQGLSTTAIADQLGIDPRSVQNYILRLRNKTGCEERIELAAWYQRVYAMPDS